MTWADAPPQGGFLSSVANVRLLWAAAAGGFGLPVSYVTGLSTRRLLPTRLTAGAA